LRLRLPSEADPADKTQSHDDGYDDYDQVNSGTDRPPLIRAA
jgi:hypothetical protein